MVTYIFKTLKSLTTLEINKYKRDYKTVTTNKNAASVNNSWRESARVTLGAWFTTALALVSSLTRA